METISDNDLIYRKDLADLVSNPIDENLISCPPANPGMTRVKTFAQCWEEANSRPDPTPLWLSLWNEGELCCLFADSNIGKSIYAMQIGMHIAQQKRVLYYDFEMTDKQFQLRYKDETTGAHPHFPLTFLRGDLDLDALRNHDEDFEEALIDDIENQLLINDVKVLIVDNLTYLCSQSEHGDAAARLMMKLIDLKKRLNLSILVLAHTPKRQLNCPITQNDLAGSKKLFNFFDSSFAIGLSAKDPNLRYIKQIKVRAGAFEYDASNVIVCEIVKSEGAVRFAINGYGAERDHLTENSDKAEAQLADNVRALREEGKTFRYISNQLGISLAKVQRIMKRLGV